MTAREVLERIHEVGGTVVAEGDVLKFRAPEPLSADVMAMAKEHKPELLALLSREGRDWARMPLSELEGLSVAIKIESDEYGDLWLVSGERERKLADGGAPTYTVLEAKQIVGLPMGLVRQVHEFKRVFDGKLDRIDEEHES